MGYHDRWLMPQRLKLWWAICFVYLVNFSQEYWRISYFSWADWVVIIVALIYSLCVISFDGNALFCELALLLQATSKKVITREEWEKRLNSVKIRKDDMNKLVMNFLVTEGYVEAAAKFQLESGTERIHLIIFFQFLLLFVLFSCLLWVVLIPFVRNVVEVAH